MLLLALTVGLASLFLVTTSSEGQGWTATWTQRGTPPRGPRGWVGAAFDAVNGRAVLFGGGPSEAQSDVWQYDAAADSWVQLESHDRCPANFAPPTGRDAYGLEYDPVNQLFWMFGGSGSGCAGSARIARLGTTLNAIVDPTLPAATLDYYRDWTVTINGTTAYVTAYNPVAKTLTLANPLFAVPGSQYFLYPQRGGGTFSYGPVTRSWGSLTGPHWRYTGSQPSNRLSPAMAYSTRDTAIVMFGGEGQNDTWALDAETKHWVQMIAAHAPGSRPSLAQLTNSMVYDSQNDVFILFGGCICTGDGWPSSRDTWAYRLATNTWTKMTPAVSPPQRQGHHLVYDSTSKVVVLFGGVDSSSTRYYNDLWVYSYASNTWTQVFPSTSPRERRDGAMVYDPAHQRTILYGGTSQTAAFHDVWTLQLQGPGTGNPAPALTSLSSDSAIVGSPAFTLTVTGANFVAASTVRWNGVSRATSYVRNTQLQASISAADIASAGTAQISVATPAPGGGTSGSLAFTVIAPRPVPTLTSISPTTATAGRPAVTLAATGANFAATSTLRVNGSDRATTITSASQLTATIPAGDLVAAGSLKITVFTPAPGGGTSASQTLTVTAPSSTPNSSPPPSAGSAPTPSPAPTLNPTPSIGSLTPASVTAGSAAFPLTVNGTGFANGVTATVNGQARATTFVSATQLNVSLQASDLVSAGSDVVQVTNPNACGGGLCSSNGFTLSVTASPPPPAPAPAPPPAPAQVPAPTLGSISPTTVPTGSGAFTLTATGTNFTGPSVLQVNGSTRATTVGSSNQLTATILANDVAAAGTLSIAVFTPAPGGGASGTLSLSVQVLQPAASLTVSPGQWVLLPGSVGSVLWRDPATGNTIDQVTGVSLGLLGGASYWVGAILDELRGHYVALNWGGHSATTDNSVPAFDILGKPAPQGDTPPAQYGGSRAWNRWSDPSPPAMQPGPGQDSPDFFPDGKAATTHSYGGMQHMLGPNGEIDRYWFTGGNKFPFGNAFQATGEYDPKTKTWRQSDPSGWGNVLSSAWDPSRLRVLLRDYMDLWQYNPAAPAGSRYTLLTNDQLPKSPGDYSGSALFDKQRSRYVEAGIFANYGPGIKYYVLDPSTGAAIRDPDTGLFMRGAPLDLSAFPDLSPDTFWRSPSFLYDEVSHDYVLHMGLPIQGGGNSSNLIFRINPDTWAVTVEKSSNSPSNSVRTGMYSKMRHLVSADLYVQVVDATEGVWLYRPTRTGVTPAAVLPASTPAPTSAPTPPLAAATLAPATATNRPPMGYLDSVIGGVVSGWAADPDRPTQAIQVVVMVDGADVATIAAGQPRPDVTAVYPQFAGNHGVVYTLPTTFQDGQPHGLRLFAIDDNGSRVELIWSNQSFVSPSAGSSATVSGQSTPAQAPVPAPASPPAPTPAPSPGTLSVLPGQPLPLRQWVERPNITFGQAFMAGSGGKHGRAFHHPGLKGLVFAGGDWHPSQPQYGDGDFVGSEIWHLNALNDRWTLLRPLCVPGEPQPGRPDTVTWAYDRLRDQGLMAPGFYGITQGTTTTCGAIEGWGGYAFSFATRKFTGPDAAAGLPAPPGSWGGDTGASYGLYDPVADELIRVRNGPGLERLNLSTKTWRVQTLAKAGDPNWNPIPNRAQPVIDVSGRAIYWVDSQSAALVRVNLSDGSTTSIPLPGSYVAPPGDHEVYLAFDPANRVVLVPNNIDMGTSPLNGLGIYHVDSGQWEWETVPSAVWGSVWGFDENVGALVGIGKRAAPTAYFLYKYK